MADKREDTVVDDVLDDVQDEVLSDESVILLADGLEEAAIVAPRKARIWEKINQKLDPEPPVGGNTFAANSKEWVPLKPGIRVKILHQDLEHRQHVSLWELAPGAVISSHRHATNEECLVLEGSVNIGGHVLNKGDFHIMDSGSFHTDVTTESGAVLYLKHDLIEALRV